MIPIKEAISSGAWLHCEYTYQTGKLYQFRMRVISFRKINLTEIDEPEKIKEIDSNASIWLIEIEVINLTKEPLSPTFGPNMLMLVDQDGFNFHDFDDFHLRCVSMFSKQSRMDRFYATELIPKIKAVGTIPFLLPEDNDAVYSISIQYDGSVLEA